jgi:sugar phosphate isomerase/epimerase
LILDIGHTAMQNVDPSALMEEWKGRLVEVHFNGVCQYLGGFMKHFPVYRNSALDYQEIVEKMKEIGFDGPTICELKGHDIEQPCEAVKEARTRIIELWTEEPPAKKIKPWELLK